MKRKYGWTTLLCAAVLSLFGGRASADSQGIGDVVTGLVAAAAVGSTYAYDDPEGRWMLLKSAGTSYTANGLLRLAFDEHEWGTRPNGKGYGFPSGHAGFMAAGAAFMQERYGWQWGVPAWLATGYVSWVRVEITDHHRWRDIAAAVVLAQGVAWWLVEPYENRGGVRVSPLFTPEATGVNLAYRF